MDAVRRDCAPGWGGLVGGAIIHVVKASSELLPPLSASPPWDEGQGSVFLATLRNFAFDSSAVRIADGLAIKRISRTDEGRLQAGFGSQHIVGEFAIEARENAGRRSTIEQGARYKFSRVVTALRLVHPRPVSLGDFVAYQPSVRGSTRDLFVAWYPDLPGKGWSGFLALPNPYELSEGTAVQLKEMYRGLLVDLGGSSKVALRRFDLAYQRQLTEDKLIDYWVGLEALFSDGQGDITYKLAMRIAHFIEESADDRGDLFRDLKKAYSLRSAVVHGGGTSAKIRWAEGLAGGALRACLSRLVLEGIIYGPEDVDRMICERR